MFSNYIKVAIRNLFRNKKFTFLNITGLAIGLASFWLIIQYVRFENSYDQIHNPDIYRVESLFSKAGSQTDHWATSTNGYAPAMKANFPEITSYTRISWRNSSRVVRYENIKFRENHVCFADSNFFSFFSYPVILGDKHTFLNTPNSVVISQASARKYFGQENPIGKQLEISTTTDQYKCQVTGVFANLPENSNMQFDMLMSWRTSPPHSWNFWYQHESYTFVQLNPHAFPEQVETKFPALSEKYKTADAMRDQQWGIKLVPLADIHLNTATPNELEVKGSRLATQFLLATGVIILLISWINYSNLATVRNMFRAKEMGIRRMIGSSRQSLITQFIVESLLLHSIALLMAVFLAEAAVALLPVSLHLRAFPRDLTTVAEFLFIFCLGVLLTGIYPALTLLRANPVSVLKGKYVFSSTDLLLRKSFIILQFAISVILIVGTIVVFRQLSYMLNQNTGIQTDQILVLKLPAKTDQYESKTQSFKDQLKNLSGISSVCESGSVPGKEVGQFLANRRFSDPPESNKTYEMLQVDYDFLKTYGLQVVAGHYFDRSRPADQYGLVINESSVQQFGFKSNEEAIGQKVSLESTPNRPNEIIGIIKDYHHQSLQHPFTPVILFMDPEYKWIPTEFYSLKMQSTNASQIVSDVQTLWNETFPESSMDYFFLSEFYQNQYRQDQLFNLLFSLFSSLSIFIACLGLLGLSAFATQQRMKEIGIRKALGASIPGIVILLVKDFLKLIIIAIIIASPIAWFSMNTWLEGYAYRIHLNSWIFLLSGVLVILLSLFTISSQAIRAAMMNPVKSLKSE
ncbi:MAG: ABC transporter permease [Siphonobacter sp.]